MTNSDKSNNNQHKKQQQGGQQPLLTPASVALSLSPPRVPPHGTALRKLYTSSSPLAAHNLLDGNNNNNIAHQESNDENNNNNLYQSHTLTSRLLQLNPLPSYSHNFHRSHPHLPSSLSIPDTLTRFLGAMLPLNYQHTFRDEGHFKSVADGLVKLSCPALVGLGGRWREAKDFVELSYLAKEIDIDNDDGNNNRIRGRSKRNGSPNNSSSSSSRGWRRKRIPYRGDDGQQHHPMQYIDLFLPSARGEIGRKNNNSQKDRRIPIRGTILCARGDPILLD